MSVTRDILLQAKGRLRIERVSVPEWGEPGHAYIRELAANQMDAAQAALDADAEPDLAIRSARLLVLCLCDKHGEPVLRNGDEAALAAGPMAPVQRCTEAALALNGLGADDAAKNSPPGQAGDSPST